MGGILCDDRIHAQFEEYLDGENAFEGVVISLFYPVEAFEYEYRCDESSSCRHHLSCRVVGNRLVDAQTILHTSPHDAV